MTVKDRFFRNLATAQAATAAYIIGHIVHAAGEAPAVGKSGPISQVCYTRPVELEFMPEEVLGPMTQGRWPSTINLRFHERTGSPSVTSSLSAVQLLMASLYEHAFIAYFENSRPEIEAKHGRVANWPNTLTFGRIVRNAFADGGNIDIRDSATAAWGGITYSASCNGRRVVYNDLSQGDLTLLMVDMDKEF